MSPTDDTETAFAVSSPLAGALDDPHGPDAVFVGRRGVAKIVSNDEQGAYTVTEQRRNSDDDAWLNAVAPLGYVAVTARDYRARDSGAAGRLVAFWEQRRQGGSLDLLIDVGLAAADSPHVMLPASFETETAQSDTWDRADQGAYDGLTVRLQTRTAYNESGDEKLYGYYRTFTFDADGALMSASAETRIEIDAPVPCP